MKRLLNFLKNIYLILIIGLNNSITQINNIIPLSNNIKILHHQIKTLSAKNKVLSNENQSLLKLLNENSLLYNDNLSLINLEDTENKEIHTETFVHLTKTYFKSLKTKNFLIICLLHIPYNIILIVFLFILGNIFSINGTFFFDILANSSFFSIFLMLQLTNIDNNLLVTNLKSIKLDRHTMFFISGNNLPIIINPIILTFGLTIILITIYQISFNVLKSVLFPKRFPKASKKQILFHSFLGALLSIFILFIMALNK